jgi:tetratricopeptide (TPR) repeat protein
MLINKTAFDLEKEALLASGVRGEKGFLVYSEKLEQLYQQFTLRVAVAMPPLAEARSLFSWLWSQKPNRYQSHGVFRLHDVVDAQLSGEDRAVGNCLGLTLLYNCLLKRIGIDAEALYVENAFGIGPHVLTMISTEGLLIDVENILPDGFDFKGHLANPSRIRWGNKELVADIYHSLGNEYFEKGKFVGALENYDRAIELNPQYEKARLNRVIVLNKTDREKNGF